VKSYLIDEIGDADVKRIHRFLSKKALSSGVDALFWVEVAPDLLTSLQQAHVPCQPHVFAVELGQGFLKAELFLRTLRDMRCSCQGYCTPPQAHFVIEWINEMLKELSIRT
jgi:hypothetical protein